MHFLLWTVVGIFGIAVVTVVALVLSTRKHMPEIASAQAAFFAETGYRHPQMLDASVEETAAFVPRRGMYRQTRYVRPDPAGPIAYESLRSRQGRTRIKSENWRMTLKSAPRVRLQIADRSVMPSLGKSIAAHFTKRTRTWAQAYPVRIELDDKELAKRFAVFGEDAEAVRRVLARPGIREQLLGCAEVDLVVDERTIRLSDPTGRILAAGAPRQATLNPAPHIRATIPVHQGVHAMLGAVRDAVT